MEITTAQCRGARAMLGISQTELAAAAAVSRQTVVDFERGARTPYPNNLTAIRAALEAAGVEFIPENGGGAGVRLKRGAYTVQAAPGGSDPDDLKAGKAEV